jgi:glyoxylase-like metal-dependent hydrolase (beta-lactamase superfamily II)
MTDPQTGSAAVHVLHEGYVREDPAGDRVGSSVTLILDGGRVIVVDPGMVRRREELLAALAAHGPGPDDVTDIVFSHHHPDHTVNAALVPAPGHTPEDIATLAATLDGVYACTHAWWGPDGPAEDPLATAAPALAASRERILAVASVIIPGHGPAFRPGPATPR